MDENSKMLLEALNSSIMDDPDFKSGFKLGAEKDDEKEEKNDKSKSKKFEFDK